MHTLETVKARSQARLTNLVEKAKEQPAEVKTWGVTAGSAVVGAVALTTVASGVLAVLATLAAPPVALTVGAVGGGLLGWNYMRNRQMMPPFTPSPAPETSDAITPAMAEASITPPVLPGEPAAVADSTIPAPPSAVAEPSSTADENLTTTPIDKLEVIHGIGPVYAGRLHAAGVHTFADLAALTPDRVREMIGPTSYGLTLDVESWLAEAQQLRTPGAE